MARQVINLGTAPTGSGGDTFRGAAVKFQANDVELYTALGGGNGTLPPALPIANGGTGANTAAAARTALGLGTAATIAVTTSATDLTAGRITKVGDFGVGVPQTIATTSVDVDTIGAGLFNITSAAVNAPGAGWLESKLWTSGGTLLMKQLWMAAFNSDIRVRQKLLAGGNFSAWQKLYGEWNTTVDANGFVKSASPIVQLYADKVELNDEAQLQGITFEKLDTGDYLIQGSSGFAQEGWYVETPKDANGNVLFSVIYDTLENGDISVKTYKKKFDLETASIMADLSQPVDITPGRWIDLRLQEIPVEELELFESSAPPDFQPTNLSQAVAEAMVTYDGTK